MIDLISRHPSARGALLAVVILAFLLLCGFATADMVPLPCVICSGVITVVSCMAATAGVIVDNGRKNAGSVHQHIDARCATTGRKIDDAKTEILAAVGAFADQHIDAVVATARHNVAELHGRR